MPDQVDWRALEREASPGRAVGRLLRDQREARGLGLSDVEKSLRIRRAHLEAIEEGRFDKLPGAAYIPAFLRAYAVHVGLDPEKVLTAYHLSGPVPIKRPVALPADFPIVEKRVPIGLAVLTVLLVVAAGYAAWHYLPRDRSVVAEKVPPVPDRLLASRPAASASTDSATPAAAPSAPAAPAQDTRNAAPSLPPEAWPAQRRDSAAAPPPPSAPPAASPPAASPPAASPPTASP
ncbi:MAG: helix-turn-helix domain-containing protein, partial [Alphaproteobacteria bacterium]|nr:helix-turn-helix domain-containing protein [Alphaproteobacteria bacterium]